MSAASTIQIKTAFIRKSDLTKQRGKTPFFRQNRLRLDVVLLLIAPLTMPNDVLHSLDVMRQVAVGFPVTIIAKCHS